MPLSCEQGPDRRIAWFRWLLERPGDRSLLLGERQVDLSDEFLKPALCHLRESSVARLLDLPCNALPEMLSVLGPWLFPKDFAVAFRKLGDLHLPQHFDFFRNAFHRLSIPVTISCPSTTGQRASSLA